MLLVEQPQAVPVGPLSVGVDVHLDDAVPDGRRDLLLGRSGAAVHHQEGRTLLLAAELLLDVGLQGRSNL